MTHNSVPPSIHMTELLNDNSVCRIIAVSYYDLQRVLTQIQLDITTAENRDTVGPTLLALKHVQDILLLFKTKGDLIIQQQEKANASK